MRFLGSYFIFWLLLIVVFGCGCSNPIFRHGNEKDNVIQEENEIHVRGITCAPSFMLVASFLNPKEDCTDGKDQRQTNSGSQESDQQAREVRAENPITNETDLETDTGSTGKLSKAHENPRKSRAIDNECFMKHVTTNKNPTKCGSGEGSKLLAMNEVALQTADYSEVLVDNEADLILSRGDGIFHWNTLSLNKIFVCKHHYNLLGRGWRRMQRRFKTTTKLKCMVPVIEGALNHTENKPREYYSFVSKKESEAILITKGVFIPPGTASCKYHSEFLAESVADHLVVRKGFDLRQIMPKSLAESPATPHATAHYRRFYEVNVPPLGPLYEDDTDEEYAPFPQGVQKSAKDIRRENIQHYIKEIAKEANIDLASIHFAKEFRKLAVSTQRQRVQVARRLMLALSDAFAPDGPEYFQNLLFDKQTLDENQQISKLDSVMTRTLACFRNATSAIAKQQVLSLVAPFLPLSELQVYLPGLSSYYFKRARLFAKKYQPGDPLPKPDTKRKKITEKQLTTLIQFITSPPIVIDLPFGTATVKSSKGVSEEIPRVVRTQVNERIYNQYRSYITETGQKDLELSRSTVLRILKYCTATTRKSLRGLDYFSFAGTEGFNMLIAISNKLAEKAEDYDWGIGITNRLKEAKQYLRTDYRLHVKEASRVPDHCMALALNDPKQKAFQTPIPHKHDLRCERCESLKEVFMDIRQQMDSLVFESDQEKQETIYDYENAVQGIEEMKKHIVRTIRQEQARTETLAALQQHEVFITLDWAMKFLPISGTEPQSDWFGKRGTSWHISHVTARDTTGQGYRTRLYIHVFDSVAQDSKAIIAILSSVLKQINRELPHVTHAYLRSDNAACYHGSETIVATAHISDNIEVKRWDFSDPQSGKGACDRAAATVKRQIALFAAENNKCTNAKEFITCANSYDGVKSATFFHVKIEAKRRRKPIISGITQYNNFEFRNFEDLPHSDIVVWRAYKIGPGLVLPRKSWRGYDLGVPMWYIGTFTEGKSNSEPIIGDRYWKNVAGSSTEDHHDLARTETDCSAEKDTYDDCDDDMLNKLMYPCPEPGCTKTYQSHTSLEAHVERGNHHYEPEQFSLRDAAIGAYKKELEGLRVPQSVPSIGDALESLLQPDDVKTPALAMGWALRTRKQVAAFSKEQRKYLTSKFDHGVRTGRKLDPQVVAKVMRKDFQKEEWLTWGQIASYWSRLARLQRKETVADMIVDEDDDSNQENVGHEHDLEDDPYFNTPEDDIYEAVDENAKEIFE